MYKSRMISIGAALIVMAMPMSAYANKVDESGCVWGIADNPIVVGDNPHGVEAGASSGSSQISTEVSGSNQTSSVTVEQGQGGSNSGKGSYDDRILGSSNGIYTPGDSTAEDINTPGHGIGNIPEGVNGAGRDGDGTGSHQSGRDKEDGFGNGKDGIFTLDDKGKSPNPDEVGKLSNGKAGDEKNNMGNEGKKNADGNEHFAINEPKNNENMGAGSSDGEKNKNITYVFWGGKNEENWNGDGTVDWESVPGSIKNITVSKDGTMTVYVTNSVGAIIDITWDEYWTQVLQQTISDKDGNLITKISTLNLKEDVLEDWTYLHTSWSMMNVTNNESKYYGGFRQVAKTHESSAKLWPDLDGRYQVIGTPWFRVRYYRMVEHEDCSTDEFGNEDCSTWTEEIDIGSETISKSPTEYTVEVPLICQGCPVPVMCINGACDPKKELNAVADDANKPSFDFEFWSELEK